MAKIGRTSHSFNFFALIKTCLKSFDEISRMFRTWEGLTILVWPRLREVPAKWGGNRITPDEDSEDGPGAAQKRPRSEAGSENPRPATSARTTKEE